MTVSAEVLFLIAGGSGRVQLVCWAAQMWVDPPDRLNTLPLGPWLSQTSAGGQRSGLAFLCPNPPWVPTYPLSRGSPSPVTHTARTCSFLLVPLFCSHTLKVSLTLAAFQLLLVPMSHFTVSHSVIFSTYLFVSCPSFSFLLPSSLVNSWVDMPAGEATPLFLVLLSFPPSLSLHYSLPVLCPAVALEGSVYPAAAEAGFICPRASLWKGIFRLWRIAHCPRWHWAPNCTTSKFGSLVL